jgi:hypothetical protein
MGRRAPSVAHGLARQGSPAPPWTVAQSPRCLTAREARAVPSVSRAPDQGTAPTLSPQRDHRCPQPHRATSPPSARSPPERQASPRSPLSYRDAAAGEPPCSRTRTPASVPEGYPTWRPGDEIFLNPTSRLRVVAVDAGTLTVERVERLDRWTLANLRRNPGGEAFRRDQTSPAGGGSGGRCSRPNLGALDSITRPLQRSGRSRWPTPRSHR